MDREILQAIREILKEELLPIKNDIKELKEGQVRLEERQDKLEKGQVRLEDGQKQIKMLIEEMDPKNANRHMELKRSIGELRKDLINVEIITSSNWNEIAKLKKVE